MSNKVVAEAGENREDAYNGTFDWVVHQSKYSRMDLVKFVEDIL